MKKSFIYVLFFLGFSVSGDLFAQDSLQKVKSSKSWFCTVNNQSNIVVGPLSLLEVKDSSMVFKRITSGTKPFAPENEEIELFVFNIGTIIGREKNIVLKKGYKGLLIGALSGFAVGGLIGLISGDLPSSQPVGNGIFTHTEKKQDLFYGARSGTMGAGVGTGIGVVTGLLANVKINLQGDMEKYKSKRHKLKRYSAKK